ncbi:SMP-30/gluconolactonase/LRE family protein [Candidatus Latescibacterota bacterium]
MIAPFSRLEKIADGFKFSEGPAPCKDGSIYFSDYGTDTIYSWSPFNGLVKFKENIGGPIGLHFDRKGNLYVCAARHHRIKVIESNGNVTEYPDRFDGKLFNSPNDIWIDSHDGVYFTDPRFAPLPEDVEQNGHYVFYSPAGTTDIIIAAGDLNTPNGITGSPDGKFVYVTDTPVDKTFVYTVNNDRTLSEKRLFADEGYDGMTVDARGNVYITMQHSIEIYDPSGNKIESISVPDKPTNVCFGGYDKKTLYITARSSLYSHRMSVRGY